MVGTRGRRRAKLPVRESRKHGSSRQGQVKTPTRRNLRNGPSRTEKGSEYQSSQKQKKRKKELTVGRRSPLPSQQIDALSPTKPRYFIETSKQTASAEKINVSSSPLRELCLTTNKGKGRKGKGEVHANNVSDSEEKENSKQIVNERDKDDRDGTLSDTNRCGIESISPKKSPALPGLFEGLGYFCFSDIDEHLSSGVLTYARKIETNSEVRFPFSYTCATKQDQMSLRKNPEQHKESELHAGTSILDLASQWTFMYGQSKSSTQKDWCPLPATTFFYINRGEYDGGSELARILNINPDTSDLFSYKVIDLAIHHDSHFSRMFIMNTGLVKGNDYRYEFDGSDPRPCILHADSLSVHDTEKFAAKVRKFLNQYGKVKYGMMKNQFHKNSLPALKLKVPRQEDGWSCGYYSLYSRFCLMKFIELNENLTNDMASCKELEQIEKEYFSYDKEKVMELRSDILYLANSLQKIKEYSKDTTKGVNLDRERVVSDVELIDLTDDDDERPPDLKFLTLTMALDQCREKKTRSKIKKQRLMVQEKRAIARKNLEELRERDNRAAKFHGKLNKAENSQKAKAKARDKLPPQRMKGEKASSLRSYKDKPYRRGLYRNIDSLNCMQRMTNYTQSVTNATMPRTTIVSFIIDPVGQYPHEEGENYAPFRKTPLRLALTGDREAFASFKKDFTENSDKYVFAETNPYQIDRELLGTNRLPLNDFIRNRPKREVLVQDKAENKAALADAKRLELTPNAKQKSEEEELEDGDMEKLFA